MILNRNRAWVDILKRALCILFYCGHKLQHGQRGTKYCSRCGEVFWNTGRLVSINKRLNHNKWGKKFFKKGR